MTKQMRIPQWIRSGIPGGEQYSFIKKYLQEKNLVTVCTEARCPNLAECWQKKTATIMILGDTCTRNCRFCSVKTGNPSGKLDSSESENVAQMIGLMELRYVVVTSVDRDDLPDAGASHFSEVVKTIREKNVDTLVEVLVPDFSANEAWMSVLGESSPFVIGHNLETVKRLTLSVRDSRASYETSLKALAFYKKNYPQIKTKSSLMLGLGETWEEILASMDDLRSIDVDILTMGQYLRPSMKQLPVERFYPPEEFEALKEEALKRGFSFVASGPLVRSSYNASEVVKSEG